MAEPTLTEVIRTAIEADRLDINVACIGVIEKFTTGPGGAVVDVAR